MNDAVGFLWRQLVNVVGQVLGRVQLRVRLDRDRRRRRRAGWSRLGLRLGERQWQWLGARRQAGRRGLPRDWRVGGVDRGRLRLRRRRLRLGVRRQRARRGQRERLARRVVQRRDDALRHRRRRHLEGEWRLRRPMVGGGMRLVRALVALVAEAEGGRRRQLELLLLLR
jgi:hypothetical protein